MPKLIRPSASAGALPLRPHGRSGYRPGSEGGAARSDGGAPRSFDVSHMGEVSFEGPRAAEAIQRLVTNDVGKMRDGSAMYTVVCRPSGGIVDDCIVYRDTPTSYLIVVNASNIEKDFAWFVENAG